MIETENFIVETRLSGALLDSYAAMECDFSTEFPTWIIAYCPDTDSWFCTNKRFFYYEHDAEFACEKDAIDYFKANITEFSRLNRELSCHKRADVFLENTREKFKED